MRAHYAARSKVCPGKMNNSERAPPPTDVLASRFASRNSSARLAGDDVSARGGTGGCTATRRPRGLTSKESSDGPELKHVCSRRSFSLPVKDETIESAPEGVRNERPDKGAQ